MNTNSSNHLQVMSAENDQIENDVKKIKLEVAHQKSFSFDENCKSSKNLCILSLCKKNSTKRFDGKNLQTFNDFTKSGKVFANYNIIINFINITI